MDTLSLIIAGSAILSVLTGVAITWTKSVWWIAEQFRETRKALFDLLDMREARDQQRHEDNIERFAVIETKINLVLKNGTH